MLRGEKRMTHYYEGFPQSDRDEKIKMVNVDELEERVKKVHIIILLRVQKMNGPGVTILLLLIIFKLYLVL